eukprot:TRINITY_DN4709_c0_g1_i4.p1 TRINITY_DN4709_c0_g1~~TRINITY_DN4709_c0_g1_i4.p1  ORF type:complete len:102 (-),score=26.25 TRINITY_DN4709_c0_g1_i4:271-576(-)
MNHTFCTFSIKRMSPEEATTLQAAWSSSNAKTSRRSYNVTTNEQRLLMLSRVLERRATITEAAKEFGVKYTTAKHILNVYLKEGRVEKKQQRVRAKRESEY